MSSGEVEELAKRYAESRDPSLRDKVVEASSNFVEKVAWGFLSEGEPLEDLIQEGYIGLIKAVDLFDPSRHVKFATYASHLISGEIRHYLRDRKSLIREPAWLYELNQRVNKVISELAQELGRLPSVPEIAQRINLTEESVLEVMKTRNLFRVSSVDEGVGEDVDWAIDKRKITSLHYESGRLPIEDKILLYDALRRLKDIERKVIESVFFAELSQTEVAKRLGVSDNYISHLIRQTMRRLRDMFLAERAEQFQEVQSEVELENASQPLDTDTGLLSPAIFEDEIAAQLRLGNIFALLFVDLDGLGEYNQKYGAKVGDEAIATIGNVIKNNVRKVDRVAKYEGGRFMLLLPHTSHQALGVGERICARVRELEPGGVDNRKLPTVSVGIVICEEKTTASGEEFQVKALRALLAAKEAGGDCAVVYSEQEMAKASRGE